MLFVGLRRVGKTYELSSLAQFERANGANVRGYRLATLALSPEGLASRLTAIASGLAITSVIYLDGLDEAMVPVRPASLIIASWVREQLVKTKPRLRISCRSAVWPGDDNVDTRPLVRERKRARCRMNWICDTSSNSCSVPDV
jgi:hypothetical protein